MQSPFKIGFPVVTLPADRGGRRAVVVFGLQDKRDRMIVLATCIDEAGVPHLNVPFTAGDMAAAPIMVLVETPGERAPRVGGGRTIVGPDGRPV